MEPLNFLDRHSKTAFHTSRKAFHNAVSIFNITLICFHFHNSGTSRISLKYNNSHLFMHFVANMLLIELSFARLNGMKPSFEK